MESARQAKRQIEIYRKFVGVWNILNILDELL